jgi:hypothetical protein
MNASIDFTKWFLTKHQSSGIFVDNKDFEFVIAQLNQPTWDEFLSSFNSNRSDIPPVITNVSIEKPVKPLKKIPLNKGKKLRVDAQTSTDETTHTETTHIDQLIDKLVEKPVEKKKRVTKPKQIISEKPSQEEVIVQELHVQEEMPVIEVPVVAKKITKKRINKKNDVQEQPIIEVPIIEVPVQELKVQEEVPIQEEMPVVAKKITKKRITKKNDVQEQPIIEVPNIEVSVQEVPIVAKKIIKKRITKKNDVQETIAEPVSEDTIADQLTDELIEEIPITKISKNKKHKIIHIENDDVIKPYNEINILNNQTYTIDDNNDHISLTENFVNETLFYKDSDNNWFDISLNPITNPSL